MGLKQYIKDKILKRKLKKMPKEQREAIEKKMQEDPEFFNEIESQIAEKKEMGQNETVAAQVLMKKRQQEMQNAMIKKNRKYKLK